MGFQSCALDKTGKGSLPYNRGGTSVMKATHTLPSFPLQVSSTTDPCRHASA